MLNVGGVKKARSEEFEFFLKQCVYKTVPRWMAQGKKIIKTVWIDLNMADEQTPNLRSRLGGKEYSDSVDPRLYAATPPVEAMTLILIVAATMTRDGHRRLVMTNDRSLGAVPFWHP